MNRVQFAVTLAVVAVAGMIGGALSDRLRGQPAYAQEEAAAGKVVEAQEFHVTDDAGRVRVALGICDDGDPSLVFLGTAGETRALLAFDQNDSPFLVFRSAAGEIRAMLAILPDFGPGLLLRGDAGDKVLSAP